MSLEWLKAFDVICKGGTMRVFCMYKGDIDFIIQYKGIIELLGTRSSWIGGYDDYHLFQVEEL